MEHSNVFREIVSRANRRMRSDKYNLDLSYITPSIIAMGAPTEKSHSEFLLRNPLGDVASYLRKAHRRVRIYNLCAEPDRQYSGDVFSPNEVVQIHILDHKPPTLDQIEFFCSSASTYLKGEDAAVAVHCKAGRGRTATLVCALLLRIGEAKTTEESLALFGNKRSFTNQSVSVPSQLRILQEYCSMPWAMLTERRNMAIDHPFVLHSVGITGFTGKRCSITITTVGSLLELEFRPNGDENTIWKGLDTPLPCSSELSIGILLQLDENAVRGCINASSTFMYNASEKGGELTFRKKEIDAIQREKEVSDDFGVILVTSEKFGEISADSGSSEKSKPDMVKTEEKELAFMKKRMRKELAYLHDFVESEVNSCQSMEEIQRTANRILEVRELYCQEIRDR